MTTTTDEPTVTEAAGLKLLSAKHRRLHPRGQVQTLRRIAVRAISKADWYEELARRDEAHVRTEEEFEYGSYDPLAPAEARRLRTDQAPLRAKANDALAACLYLNRVHGLGYPVPR